MKNKKRISKLISKKYKTSRKVIFFKHHKMGWDFGTQFRDKQKKIFEINIKEYSSKDWEKEYMNIPVTRLGLPELKKRVRELERQMRNIPVCTIQFYKKADELREARKEMQAFIREYNFHILPEIPILISPNITKHLF